MVVAPPCDGYDGAVRRGGRLDDSKTMMTPPVVAWLARNDAVRELPAVFPYCLAICCRVSGQLRLGSRSIPIKNTNPTPIDFTYLPVVVRVAVRV